MFNGEPSEASKATPLEDGQTIHIPISAEGVDVTKEKRPIGEVVIGKRAVEETQHFKDTIRHEEAHLEREGDIPFMDTTPDQHRDQPGV
jgi:uncharacterized protein (TIGR02271 family)